MYAAHFATALLFHCYYPSVNSFLFTFGVMFLDIVFAILAYFTIEGIRLNPNAGLLGFELHCPFSHSLLGSFVLSCLWGCMCVVHKTTNFLPVFLSSFSHFLEDWLIHNRHLQLHPFSSFCVGGTGLCSKYPRGTYYLEFILCICCSAEIYRRKNFDLSMIGISLFLSILYIFYLHFQFRPSVSGQFTKFVKAIPDKQQQGRILFPMLLKLFVTPALVLGVLLEFPRFMRLFT
ncbi:unnamed protein product [Didymodactylos carnosus]|uniref:Uncharacterized protein n=1 Tax=Didymodactylos carnosus TaxID=1234261 RepID=A0A815ZUW2_9BILA|nr:unnamed protein product [Didymodactylos carnosus]CAF4457322.1 unnamed protein product [Didymodactylos carnosus]